VQTKHLSTDELADAVLGAMPDLDPAGERLAIALHRLLAEGSPVGTVELAAATGLAEPDVAGLLGEWPGVFSDDQGRVAGFWGQAISELSPTHRLEAGGQVLYGWCAFDTLFLPGRLGQVTQVTSTCPVTGEEIRLTVGPDKILDVSHPGAVISFLLPDGPFSADVVQSFCHFVLFFASREAGKQWTAQHPGTFLLTLGEAFDLAVTGNRRMFPNALAGGR